jgi:hypothetical protein
MQHKDMINVLPRQTVFNPLENILAPEEHAAFNNGCTGNIGISQVVQESILNLRTI